MRRAFSALFPGALVFVLAVTAFFFVDKDFANAADQYGLAVYGAGLALSWVFHRSRVFIALVCLGLLDITVVGEQGRSAELVTLGTSLLGLIGLLGLVRDRGVLSRVGLMHFGAVAFLVSGSSFLFFGASEGKAPFQLPQIALLEGVAWPGFPRVTLAVGLVSFLAVMYGFHRWRGPVERSLIWSVVLMLTALHPDLTASDASLFLMATGLTLTLGVVETSYILAYRDELTGLPGRRALMQYLDGLQGTYTIAMVDVDHFKSFNDRHGHDVGDQVLQLVASRLARAPGGGRAYRYGGEEFTLLYSGMTRDEALPYLEATRISVEKARFALRSWKRPRKKPEEGGKRVKKTRAPRKPRTLSVTVSIGMADTTGKDATSEAVMKKADQALYRAKEGGRNQTSE